MAAKPLSSDIPTDQAWKEGRRVYVRCGARSRTNDDLRAIGARWDREVVPPGQDPLNSRPGALWVGSTKAEQVIAILAAANVRAAATEEVKARGLWVQIPYEATDIREAAKRLGARWDKDRKSWAMPTPEAHAEVTALVTARAEQAEQAKISRKKADAAARAAQVEQAKEDAATRIVAESGRVLTGETATVVHVSTARYNRASAEAVAHPIGHVIHLRDGRRGIVTDVKIWFTGSDMASSVCWHQETHDEAHWDWRYELAIVEPTDAELAADERAAARAADETELGEAFTAMRDAARTEAGEQGEWSPVTGPKIARVGGTTQFSDGHLILDLASSPARVVFQHPGYYDDYRRSERSSTDPDLVAKVRALVGRGPRKVGAYTVTA